MFLYKNFHHQAVQSLTVLFFALNSPIYWIFQHKPAHVLRIILTRFGVFATQVIVAYN